MTGLFAWISQTALSRTYFVMHYYEFVLLFFSISGYTEGVISESGAGFPLCFHHDVISVG